MVITDQAQFEQLVQEVRDQILSESQGVGEVDIVDNLDSIYSLPALKLNDNGDQVVEAPLSLLSAPAEEAAATANAAAQAANTAAESANNAASSANQVVEEANTAIGNATLATQKAESSAEKANTAAQSADEVRQQFVADEEARVQAENERVQAEQDRTTAEQSRVQAESDRQTQFEQLKTDSESATQSANAAAELANTAASNADAATALATEATTKAEEATANADTATDNANTAADAANQAAQKADDATTQVLSGESERVEAENARQAAEAERQSAEEERKSAEEARKLAEQSREEAEASRVSAEESRVTAESERVTAESSRAQAETERVQKESERESAEQTRQDNENTRVQQEQTRQTNEEQRVSAESSRETEYADLKQRSDALIDDNEAAIENANTAAENANAAIANMENTYAKKDEIPDVSEFITISVDNLVNYYRKSETYNQEQINSLIGSITTINFKIVDSLPGTGENNLIYLVPSNKQEENNVKDEYIWVDGSWELIGSTKIDLSNYYTKDEVNSTFALKTELAWDTITGKPVWIGSSKPTYTWSEINEKPTTINGYGITDAYTKNESDGRYVNTTGDTMTGGLNINYIYFPELSINNTEYKVTTQLGNSSNSDTILRNIYNGVNTDLRFNSSSLRYKGYEVLHTGNYYTTTDTRYVKKSGDIMTGEFLNTSNIKVIYENHGVRLTGDSNYGYLQLGNITSTAEEQRGIIGGYSGAGLDSLDIRVKSSVLSNAVTINDNTVWHAGNDGSGSGLDADLLDGVHNGSLTAAYTHDGAIRANRVITKADNNGWPTYFIIADCTDTVNAPNSGKHYGFTGIIIEKRTCGYINEYISRVTARVGYSMVFYSLKSDSDRITSCILKNGSNYYLALKSLGSEHQLCLYGFEINLLQTFTQISTTDSAGTLPDGYSIAYSGSGMDFFGNITSATKLQTPRTIWGQSFDGTANVSGAMTGVSSISFSNSTACDLDVYGNVIFKSTNDANTWNVLNPDKTSFISVRAVSGNVGIGVPTSNYKLHVNGTFYASGAATLGSTLTVNGDLTVKGTIIDSTSSDIRLKSILERVDYQEKLLSLGDVVDFDYNDTAFSRENSSNLEHRSYTGLIYQNVKEILPQMAHEDDDGYGYLNYLSHDYINLIAGALQQTITKQKQLEKRISILEEENINLKQQLSN